MNDFATRLVRWHRRSGRHDLPWQQDKSPYRIWISEIMLQQTQVNTVIPYYNRFLQRFPDLEALAQADLDEVLHVWTGLGYYSRARNLHRAAGILMERYRGRFPADIDDLITLPGIGRSTAGAILALARDLPFPILDGNVKRVLCRYRAVEGWPGQAAIERQLWELAESLLPARQAGRYTQAIMDLGALVCTRSQPACDTCPVAAGCEARRQGRQDEIPTPRPGKQLPRRQTRFVMINDRDTRVLLERRPPSGIWGGLWSFPECRPDTDIRTWVRDQYGLKVNEGHAEPSFRHSFSHFQLEIEPVFTRLSAPIDVVRDDPGLYWYTPNGDNRRIGLAGPVRKLIKQYFG